MFKHCWKFIVHLDLAPKVCEACHGVHCVGLPQHLVHFSLVKYNIPRHHLIILYYVIFRCIFDSRPDNRIEMNQLQIVCRLWVFVSLRHSRLGDLGSCVWIFGFVFNTFFLYAKRTNVALFRSCGNISRSRRSVDDIAELRPQAQYCLHIYTVTHRM